MPVTEAQKKATELHMFMVCECAAQLDAAYDAARPERIAIIVEDIWDSSVKVGFGTRDEVVDLLRGREQEGARGAAALAAALGGLEDAGPGKFLCVIAAGGMTNCYEFDLTLLKLRKRCD
jgi:hypothetical protein